ncbi:MAG: hypothetical protein WCW40_09165 [Bacteroidota bacterium]
MNVLSWGKQHNDNTCTVTVNRREHLLLLERNQSCDSTTAGITANS